MGNNRSSSSSSEDELDGLAALMQMFGAAQKQKLEQFKAGLAAYIQSAKREQITLTWPNFADSAIDDDFHLYSEPVEMAGIQWKLLAKRVLKDEVAGLFALALVARHPFHCCTKFEVDYSLRISNTDSTKDVRKEGQDSIVIPRDEYAGHFLVYHFGIEDLADPKKGFVREDGSIQMELNFTVINGSINPVVLGAVKQRELNELKTQLTAYIQAAKREHFSLTVPNFAELSEKEEFDICSQDSDSLEVPGSVWKFGAIKFREKADRLYLSLAAMFTLDFAIKFDVNYSVRLFNADSTKDLRKEGNECLEFAEGIFAHLRVDFAEIKDLADPKKGFVREDGSIQMEINFTITNAKVVGMLVDADEESSSEEEDSSDEESSSSSGEDEESGIEDG